MAEYILIPLDDGTVYVQRRDLELPSDSSLQAHERVIIKLHDELDWFRQCLQAIAEDGCEGIILGASNSVPCKDRKDGGGVSFKHWCHPCQASEWLKGRATRLPCTPAPP